MRKRFYSGKGSGTWRRPVLALAVPDWGRCYAVVQRSEVRDWRSSSKALEEMLRITSILTTLILLEVTQLNTDSLAENYPVRIQNYPQLRKPYL
jgi:hypothetical protein